MSTEKTGLTESAAHFRELREENVRNAELAELRAKRVAELEAKLGELHEVSREIHTRDAHIAALEAELTQAKIRLSQIQSSPVVKAWNRLKRVPPLSWIASRRAHRYWQRVDAADGR